MYIPRKLEQKVLKYLSAPEIIAIVGPRQCGKTTLLKRVFENLESASMISFEDQTLLRMFENNIDDFIEIYVKNKKYLLIDEFQYAKHGVKKLKYIWDTQKIKILISGSSNIDLTVNALKFLVGRIFILNLFPLDFTEFLSYKAPDHLQYLQKLQNKFWSPKKIGAELHNIFLEYYDEYLIFGGYPRVVLAIDQAEKMEVLKNIYNTYFLREVRDILGLIDDYKLDRLIKALALQVGNIVEYKELSLVSEYNHITLKKYLNFLEKTFVCSFVKPFFKNKRVEIVKNPKIYFYDTGLRNSIVNDFRKLKDRPDAGAILENGVFQQLLKRDFPCNYWRDKSQHEIDFIIQLAAGKKIALEVKKLAREGKTKSLHSFKKYYEDVDQMVVYMDKIGKMKTKSNPIYSI